MNQRVAHARRVAKEASRKQLIKLDHHAAARSVPVGIENTYSSPIKVLEARWMAFGGVGSGAAAAANQRRRAILAFGDSSPRCAGSE